VRFEVFIVVMIQVEAFWVMMPYIIVDGGSKVLEDVGILLQHCMEPKSRSP
jgi:hypothetical protein